MPEESTSRSDGRKRRCFVASALAVSLLGGALLAYVAGRGQRLEYSSIRLSDAPPTSATVFEDAKPPPPKDGTTEIGGHGGGITPPAKQRAETATELPGPVPPPPPPPPPPAPARVDRVNVYVYDDVPELDFSGLIQCYRDRNDDVPPWQDEQADMAQDMGEIWLHRAILSHPWRVLDPEEADVFYVPMYPVLSFKLELGGVSLYAKEDWARTDRNRCEGLTHTGRMDAAVEYLSLSSPFFNRFGGADHVLVCAWWHCRGAVDNRHRMLLRRTVVGINEDIYKWHWWGCGPGRAVTVPYTASSVLTSSSMIGGRPAEERDIPFFFVGTARNRPERLNLDVVKNIAEDSVILLGGEEHDWGMNSTVYAEHMARSRFCFCPRGDSASSRRIFDALAAGCIPIVTEDGKRVLPFVKTGLNYSEFAIVVGPTAFSSREGVKNTTLAVLARSDEELAEMRGSSKTGVNSVLYGATLGSEVSDMHPFQGTATMFLQATYAATGGGGAAEGNTRGSNLWGCRVTKLSENQLARRTDADLPPVPWQRRRWLAESETIVNKHRSLLFCAPPNAGSLQFRMLAKRMQGVSHWSMADHSELLFDPTASELELLDVTDGPLMTEIYKDNGSGWIKIVVVRDPVTRLLSAYLDIVRTWRAGLQDAEQDLQSPPSSPKLKSTGHDRKRQLRQAEDNEVATWRGESGRKKAPLGGTSSEWEFLDAILEMRQLKEEHARSGSNEETTARNIHHRDGEGEESGVFYGEGFLGRDGPETRSAARLRSAEEERAQGLSNRALDAGEMLSGNNGADIPTFAEVVDALKVHLWKAPTAFRPSASLCGQQNSPFDSVIPFERLQNTSTEVLKSLPGGIWESYGASGWGPHGKHAFMEFDYGGAAWRKQSVGGHREDGQQEGEGGDPLPRRASDLFEGESCAWTEYYGDMETLEFVNEIYALDYSHFRWYQLGPWKERLKGCLN